MALAFALLFPHWFVRGEFLKVHKNECMKPSQRVTPNKHNIYHFKLHLHVNINHVRVETLIHEGEGKKNLVSIFYILTYPFFLLIPDLFIYNCRAQEKHEGHFQCEGSPQEIYRRKNLLKTRSCIFYFENAKPFQITQHFEVQIILSLELFYYVQIDDATFEGGVAEEILEPIHVEDSSPEPPPLKKKPRNPGTDAKKSQPVLKLLLLSRRGRRRRFPQGRRSSLRGNQLLTRVPILVHTHQL